MVAKTMGNYLPDLTVASPGNQSAPFVGHVAQLHMVRALVTRATGRSGALALVCAEAGMGKTRFLQEVAARESRSALVIALDCASARRAERHSLREQLSTALGDRDISSLARQRPVLCTVDDLHEATLDDRTVVDELFSAYAVKRVVVLAACASEWSGIGYALPPWLRERTQAGALSINLAPLDRARSEILLKAMLTASRETTDAQTAAAILRIAAGSPRYLRELVSRLPEVRAGNAQLVPHSAEAQVIRLRSELEAIDFTILREASAFGSEFTDESLVRVLRRPKNVVTAALQTGVDAGLLRELAPNRPSAFVFRDEAVRFALYQTLVTAQRKMLHERIAAELCANASRNEFGALAARHWAEAGDAGRAVAALQEAAARAARLLNFGEARELIGKASGLAERNSDAWWSAQEQLADYAAALGEFRGASKIRRKLPSIIGRLGVMTMLSSNSSV